MSLFQSSAVNPNTFTWKLGQPLDEFLGPDLFLYVLKFANPRDVASAACVSKKWNTYCTNEALWEYFYKLCWPIDEKNLFEIKSWRVAFLTLLKNCTNRIVKDYSSLTYFGIVGSAKSGKTTLLEMIFNGRDFHSASIEAESNQLMDDMLDFPLANMETQMRDTIAETIKRAIFCDAVIGIFDTSDKKSLEYLDDLFSKIRKYRNEEWLYFYLIENKIDLTSVITDAEIAAFRKKYKIDGFSRISLATYPITEIQKEVETLLTSPPLYGIIDVTQNVPIFREIVVDVLGFIFNELDTDRDGTITFTEVLEQIKSCADPSVGTIATVKKEHSYLLTNAPYTVTPKGFKKDGWFLFWMDIFSQDRLSIFAFLGLHGAVDWKSLTRYPALIFNEPIHKYLKFNALRDIKRGNHVMELMLKYSNSKDVQKLREVSCGIATSLKTYNASFALHWLKSKLIDTIYNLLCTEDYITTNYVLSILTELAILANENIAEQILSHDGIIKQLSIKIKDPVVSLAVLKFASEMTKVQKGARLPNLEKALSFHVAELLSSETRELSEMACSVLTAFTTTVRYTPTDIVELAPSIFNEKTIKAIINAISIGNGGAISIIHTLCSANIEPIYKSIVKVGINVLVDVVHGKIEASSSNRTLAAECVSYLAYWDTLRDQIRKANGMDCCIYLLKDAQDFQSFALSGINNLLGDDVPNSFRETGTLKLLIGALLSLNVDFNVSKILKILCKDVKILTFVLKLIKENSRNNDEVVKSTILLSLFTALEESKLQLVKLGILDIISKCASFQQKEIQLPTIDCIGNLSTVEEIRKQIMERAPLTNLLKLQTEDKEIELALSWANRIINKEKFTNKLYSSRPELKWSNDEMQVRNDTSGDQSFRGNHIVTRGLWYYEVTLTTDGKTLIGWGDKGNLKNPQSWVSVGVGFDSHSYSVELKSLTQYHNKIATAAESRIWKAGDILGVYLDCVSKTIRYTLNGADTKIIFTKVETSSGLTVGVTVPSRNQVEINLGQKQFKYSPGEFKPFIEAISQQGQQKIEYTQEDLKVTTKRQKTFMGVLGVAIATSVAFNVYIITKKFLK